MRLINKIIEKLSLLVLLASFMVSTTGFTFSTHTCSHNNEQAAIVADANCCTVPEPKPVEKTDECCKTSCCELEKPEDDCCTFDVTYYRLTEYYIQNSIDEQKLNCEPIEIEKFDVVRNETGDSDVILRNDFSQEKIPKPKRYLLFHQVKLEPPLI